MDREALTSIRELSDRGTAGLIVYYLVSSKSPSLLIKPDADEPDPVYRDIPGILFEVIKSVIR